MSNLVAKTQELLRKAKIEAEYAKKRIAELTMDINFAGEESDIYSRDYQVKQLAKYLNRISILEGILQQENDKKALQFPFVESERGLAA